MVNYTTISDNELNQMNAQLSQESTPLKTHDKIFKQLVKVRSQDKRRVFQKLHSSFYKVLQSYNRNPPKDSMMLAHLLVTLNLFLENEQNAKEWTDAHGEEFIKIVLLDCFLPLNDSTSSNVEHRKIAAMKVLASCCKVSDAYRKMLKNKGAARYAIDMLKSNDFKAHRAAAGFLEMFSLDDANKDAIAEIDGASMLVKLLETSKEITAIESIACALSAISLNHAKNAAVIAEKCPVDPLGGILVHALKNSSSDLSEKSIKTGPLHEPEFIRLMGKVLKIIRIITDDPGKLEVVYSMKGMNIVELLLSLVCFLHCNEKRSYETVAQSAIENIIAIISNLLALEPVRKIVFSELSSSKSVSEEHFYIYIQGKVMNGAKLILSQFMNSGLLSEAVAQFLLKLASHDPESLLKLVDINNGECSFYVKSLSYVKSDSVDIKLRVIIAQLIGCVISNENNRKNIPDVIRQGINATVFHLLSQQQSNHLQSAAFEMLRHLELEEPLFIQDCLEMLEKYVPQHLIIKWLFSLDFHKASQHKIIFSLLEVLKNLLLKEKMSAEEFAYLGVLDTLISFLDIQVFKDISLLIMGASSGSTEVRDDFAKLGGIEKLLHLLAEENEMLLLGVLTTINNITEKCTFTQTVFSELGGVQILLHMLEKKYTVQKGSLASPSTPTSPSPTSPTPQSSSSATDQKIQLLIVSTIVNLLELQQNLRFATKCNAVSILLPFCQTISASLTKKAVEAIYLLSSVEENKLLIASSEILVSLLECEKPDIQETVCNIMSNVALRSDCREALIRVGAYSKLQNLLESDYHLLSLLAQMVLNHFKQVDISTLKRKASELSTESIDFEAKKKEIETEYARRYEAMIKRSSIRASANTAYDQLTVEIDWTFFDQLKNDDQKRSALHLMKRNMWDNLRKSIYTFCDQSAHHSQALLFAVRTIVVQFAENSHIKYVPPQQSNPKAQGGILYYNVGYDEMNSMPVQEFVEQLNALFDNAIKKFRRNSVLAPQDAEFLLSNPKPSVLADAQKNPIQVLQTFAKEAIMGPQQLMALSKLISNAPYHKLNPNDATAVQTISKHLLPFEERLIKGYKVIRLDEDGYKQERFLLITDKSFYTVKYDMNRKDYDKRSVNCINLKELYVIDVGHFEKYIDKVYVNVFTRQHFSRKRSAAVAPSKKAIALNSPGDTTEPKRVRPFTNNCMSNLFTPPYAEEAEWSALQQKSDKQKENMEKSKLLMQEIAWVLYAAATNYNGTDMYTPFEDQVMEQPVRKLSSFIYNKLKFVKL